MMQRTAVRCSECDEPIAECEVCTEPGCPRAICYSCITRALGETMAQPHARVPVRPTERADVVEAYVVLAHHTVRARRRQLPG